VLHAQLEAMDIEGIDMAVLYCGLGQSLGGFDDVELAVASHQVWNDWIADWNTHPRPFLWTKTAEEILDSLARFCRRTSGAGH